MQQGECAVGPLGGKSLEMSMICKKAGATDVFLRTDLTKVSIRLSGVYSVGSTSVNKFASGPHWLLFEDTLCLLMVTSSSIWS